MQDSESPISPPSAARVRPRVFADFGVSLVVQPAILLAWIVYILFSLVLLWLCVFLTLTALACFFTPIFLAAREPKMALILLISIPSSAFFGALAAWCVRTTWLLVLRPWFERTTSPPYWERNQPLEEPRLRELIDRFSEILAVEPPVAVYPSLEARVSVFRTSQDGRLALHLGLTCAAALSLQQFAGLLARELAHVREITLFRWRIFYGSAQRLLRIFQAYLQRDRQEFFIRRRFVRFTRPCDQLIQGIVRGALGKVQSIVAYARRFHEREADRAASRIVGPAVYPQLQEKLTKLDVVSVVAESLQAEAARAGYRVVDRVSLFQNAMTRLPFDWDRLRRDAAFFENQVCWYETHPSYAERTRRTDPSADAAVLEVSDPATTLFEDFDAFDRQVSEAAHSRAGGTESHRQTSIRGASVVDNHLHIEAALDALSRWFADRWLFNVPWVARFDAKTNPEGFFSLLDDVADEEAALVDHIRVCRKVIVSLAREQDRHWTLWAQANRNEAEVRLAERLIAAGVSFSPEFFSSRLKLKRQRVERTEGAHEMKAAAEATMDGYLEACGRRLQAAMRLLARDDFRSRVTGGEELYSRCRRLQPVIAAFAASHDTVNLLHWHDVAIQCLLYLIRVTDGSQSRRQGHFRRIEQLLKEELDLLRATMETLRNIWRDVSFPLFTEGDEVDFADFLLKAGRFEKAGHDGRATRHDDLRGAPEFFRKGQTLFDRYDPPEVVLPRYWYRFAAAFGQYAAAAEAVEAELGLSPLEIATPSPRTEAPTCGPLYAKAVYHRE